MKHLEPIVRNWTFTPIEMKKALQISKQMVSSCAL